MGRGGPLYVDAMAADHGKSGADPEYLYIQVADRIEARIAAHKLHAGAALPGEQRLARQEEVSVATIRRAMEVLRERDLVKTLKSKGTFIKESELTRSEPATGSGQEDTPS